MRDVDDENRFASNALRDLLVGSFANYAFPIAALVTSPILARGLGPGGRGALTAVLAPLTVADAVAALGAPLAATFFIGNGRNLEQVRRYGVIIATGAGLVTVLALIGLSGLLLNNYPEMRILFCALAPSVLLGGYINLYRGIRAGSQNYGKLNANLWAGALSRLFVIVLLALLGFMTPTTVAVFSIATGLLAGLTLFKRRSRTTGEALEFRQFASYSIRSWFGILGGSITARIDQILLIALVSPVDLGNYAVAVTLAELPNSVSIVVQRLFLVRNVGDARGAALRGMRLTTAFNLAVAVSFIAIANPLVRLLFGPKYTSAAGLLSILVLGTAAWGLGQAASGLLFVAERPGVASLADVLAAAVMVATIYPAVLWEGSMGAAIVSSAAYFIGTVIKLVVLFRLIKFRWRDVLLANRSDALFIRNQARQILAHFKRKPPHQSVRKEAD